MTNTTNTVPTRVTVLVRTISGAEYTLSTPNGGLRTVESFNHLLQSHRTFRSMEPLRVGLINGGTVYLNIDAVESFKQVPVPLTPGEGNGVRSTVQRYVDELDTSPST